MRAIDTNVVIRFLTADDARDYKAARAVIEAGGVHVPLTVFLESEWVLRSAYGLSRVEIADGLAGLAGLPAVSVEEPAMLAMALGWMRDGMDFADALHLAKAKDCTSFLTFDRKLAKLAKKRSALPVELL
ncbi:MAG: type II toxin-antitoxin system VapC family toxin [Parvularculaceae bacterium]|nr:type II toxin-antitoxin system VapC family toxin [Parvularculaceae bacterium]